MTPDLDAIEARIAAATPGPWEARGLAYSTCVGRVGDYRNLARLGDPLDQPAWRNADLIAHAPTDLAALVAEVTTLRARLARAEKVAEAAEAWFHDDRSHSDPETLFLVLRDALGEWRTA